MQDLYKVLVRKDSSSIIPLDVPEYEIPLLYTLYGEENVLNVDLKRVDEAGMGEPVGQFKPSPDEHGRFAAKYGQNDEGPIVEQVYGKKALKAIDKLLAKEEAKPAAKAK
jgi:hypothetical protein